jgi:hypothetical protein
VHHDQEIKPDARPSEHPTDSVSSECTISKRWMTLSWDRAEDPVVESLDIETEDNQIGWAMALG